MSVEEAKALLAAEGYVVLREKSYRQAQERQRVAEALRRAADEDRESHYRWMQQDVFPEERRLRERLTYLYGLAARHGATNVELAGDDHPDGWTPPSSLEIVARWDGDAGQWVPVERPEPPLSVLVPHVEALRDESRRRHGDRVWPDDAGDAYDEVLHLVAGLLAEANGVQA